MIEGIKHDLKVFWERASLWGSEDQIEQAKKEIKEQEIKLKKWKKRLAELPGKRIKSAEERREEAHAQSQTFKVPFFKGRRERLESIVARHENELELAKAHLEGVQQWTAHAKKQLKKLGEVI